jgi:hypothetical protein
MKEQSKEPAKPQPVKQPITWPFPAQLIRFDEKLPKFNPENYEDALL